MTTERPAPPSSHLDLPPLTLGFALDDIDAALSEPERAEFLLEDHASDFELVDSYGGAHKGVTYWKTFRHKNRFYHFETTYNSWQGPEVSDDTVLVEVFRKKRTVTIYEPVNEELDLAADPEMAPLVEYLERWKLSGLNLVLDRLDQEGSVAREITHDLELLESYGGQDCGEDYWKIFRYRSRFFRLATTYSSWDELEFHEGSLTEVAPQKVRKTAYLPPTRKMPEHEDSQ